MTNQSNSTTTPLFRYWVYVGQGTLIVICNVLVFLAITQHKTLRKRKELALPALLAFNDAASALASVIAGAKRNYLLYHGTAGTLVSRWDCLTTSHNLLWVPVHHTIDSILLAISVDRFVAINWPLYHYGLTMAYAKLMMTLSTVPGLGFAVLCAYLSSFYTEKEKSIICFTSWAMDSTYYSTLYAVRIVISSGSVLLYIIVIGAYFYNKNKQPGSQSGQMKEYNKSQRKLTVTLGISCIFTTIFYVGPLLGMSWFGQLDSPIARSLIPYAHVAENMNRFANIFLYSMRHRNIRLGVMYLFLRKQLPQLVIDNRVVPQPNQKK